MGALVRGPDAHRDIHLDPVSHPNAKDAGLTGLESSGRWSTVPAARKQVVSHFPLEERSSYDERKDYRRWYTVRSEAELVDVFPFPNSRRKVCEDREKHITLQERGTAKLSGLGVLSLWLWVVGLMAHLWS